MEQETITINGNVYPKHTFIEISNEDYHAETNHLSASKLVKWINNPRSAYLDLIDPQPLNNINLSLGSAIHEMILEHYELEHALLKNGIRPKDLNLRTNKDKELIKQYGFENAEDMHTPTVSKNACNVLDCLIDKGNIDALRKKLTGENIINEKAIFTNLVINGYNVPVKCKVDSYDTVNKILDDIKTLTSL